MRLPLRVLVIGVAAVLAFVLPNAVELATDWWWFGEVGHRQVFTATLRLQAVLGGATLALALAWLVANVKFAARTLPVRVTGRLDAGRPDHGVAGAARVGDARHGAGRRRGGHRGVVCRVQLAGGARLAAGRGVRRDRPRPGLRRRLLRLHAAGRSNRPGRWRWRWSAWPWPVPPRSTCWVARWPSRRSGCASVNGPAGTWACSSRWCWCYWRWARGSTGRASCSPRPASSAAPATPMSMPGCRSRSRKWPPASSAPASPSPTRSPGARSPRSPPSCSTAWSSSAASCTPRRSSASS